MNKIVFYMFVLIALLILVAYFKGSTNIVNSVGGVVSDWIIRLQGRDSTGKFAAYPQG